jgi:NAD(P)-dependent dehydrogenase (short-subunit alcohol dehydrogenase family)
MSNKVFLITGATSGIGLATCESLLLENEKVIAVGRNEQAISHLAERFPLSFHFRKFDLLSINEIEEEVNSYPAIFGKMDGMVHCAGIEETLPITLYTPEKIKHIFEINVFTGMELLRIFTKKKNCNDAASIIFLSSVMGMLGQPGKAGYCATKSAVIGMVRSSALELAKRKIRVNAILPGIVKTPMTEKLFNQLDENNIELIKKSHPLGIGEVEDLIPMLLLLLSDGSRWITGQNIILDGGYSIQ